MDAFRSSVRLPQLKQRLDPMLAVMIQDKLSELAIAKKLGPAQLQSFSQDLNDLLVGMLQADFDDDRDGTVVLSSEMIGITVTD